MRQRVMWGVVLIIVLLMIWGNSMLPGSISGTISSQTSKGILSVLYQIVPNCLFDFNQFHSFIRKLAHFGEYALLGICSIQFIKTYPTKHALLYAFLFCLLCALIDEGIQVFTPNRLAKVSDSLLDSLGAACGMLLCDFIQRRKKHVSNGR